MLPDSVEILKPIGAYRLDIDSAQPAINDWLDSLGYTENMEGMNGEPGNASLQDSGSRQQEVNGTAAWFADEKNLHIYFKIYQ